MKKETYLGGCLLGVFTGALLFASSAAFAATDSTSVDGVEATAIDLHLYAPYGLVFTVR